jgi:CRISPR system Cascade subunit CasA
MTFSFNLWTEPWIPAVDHAGRGRLLGIRTLLAEAHTLREIQGDVPPETAALYRLLLAILHRVFGPPDRATWRRLYDAGAFEMTAIDAYAAVWAERFDLFHPKHPFGQAADPRVKPKSVISLALEMAQGNNAVLFDHHTEADGATLDPAQAARKLLAAQAFAVGGLTGLEEKFTDTPWAKGVVFMAQGDSLFETLLLNLVVVKGDAPMPQMGSDLPAWERDDACHPGRIVPSGYLDYLTWTNRRILLMPVQLVDGSTGVREMTWAPALRLELKDPDPFFHATANKEKSGPAWRVLQFNAERALWRDSSTLFTLNKLHDVRAPVSFVHLAHMVAESYLPVGRALRFMAIGMSKDKAKIEFFRLESSALPLAYLARQELVDALGDELRRAEDVGRALRRAVVEFGRALLLPMTLAKDREEPLGKEKRNQVLAFVSPWETEGRYWADLDLAFPQLLHDLVGPAAQGADARQRWRVAVRAAALAAFEHALGAAGAGPRAFRGAVKGQASLTWGLRQALEDTPETTMEGEQSHE